MRNRIWIPEAPFVLRGGRTREILLGLHARVHGRFKSVELVHAATGVVVRRLEFDNLLVDTGLDALAFTHLDSLLQQCRVGTGTTPPAAGQTSLVNEVASTSSSGGTSNTSATWSEGNIYRSFQLTRVFSTSQANANLTEVGMFGSNNTMICRQLMLDEQGQPTTIPKTPDFELRVTYEFRIYPPNGIGDFNYNALIQGVNQSIVGRPIAISSWPAMFNFGGTSLGTVNTSALSSGGVVLGTNNVLQTATATSLPGGITTTSRVNQAYTAGNFFRDQIQEWNASVANNTNYQAWACSLFGMIYQALLPAPVSKTNTEKFTLVARVSWGRY